MNNFVFILIFCIYPFSASFDISTSDIMSHKNWKLLPAPNKCGRNRHNSRIVGGHEAPLGQFLWFCRLGYRNQHSRNQVDFRCGGTLINDRYVLTAAHCVKGFEKLLRIVRVGENLENAPNDCSKGKCGLKVRDIMVEDIIMHPGFNLTSYKGDIALIRLRDKVQHNAYIQPVCLPRDEILEKSFFGEKFTVIGWGRDQASAETLSRSLKYVEVPMRDLCACQEIYSQLPLDDSQICVGVSDGRDSCDGDSGGPLTWLDKIGLSRIHYQIGLVSFGRSYCGESPSIYTSSIYYMPWILDNIYL